VHKLRSEYIVDSCRRSSRHGTQIHPGTQLSLKSSAQKNNKQNIRTCTHGTQYNSGNKLTPLLGFFHLGRTEEEYSSSGWTAEAAAATATAVAPSGPPPAFIDANILCLFWARAKAKSIQFSSLICYYW
jgi:hypothetical protein